ncbi:hypothetical protein MMC21_002653 [Puttea exsequens]|nr:hypothetical protein [Puttea exsequens]
MEPDLLVYPHEENLIYHLKQADWIISLRHLTYYSIAEAFINQFVDYILSGLQQNRPLVPRPLQTFPRCLEQDKALCSIEVELIFHLKQADLIGLRHDPAQHPIGKIFIIRIVNLIARKLKLDRQSLQGTRIAMDIPSGARKIILEDPPEDAVPGSRHRPWMHLSLYELVHLQNRSGTDHSWTPSKSTIRDMLLKDKRGPFNRYEAAVQAKGRGMSPTDESIPADEYELMVRMGVSLDDLWWSESNGESSTAARRGALGNHMRDAPAEEVDIQELGQNPLPGSSALRTIDISSDEGPEDMGDGLEVTEEIIADILNEEAREEARRSQNLRAVDAMAEHRQSENLGAADAVAEQRRSRNLVVVDAADAVRRSRDLGTADAVDEERSSRNLGAADVVEEQTQTVPLPRPVPEPAPTALVSAVAPSRQQPNISKSRSIPGQRENADEQRPAKRAKTPTSAAQVASPSKKSPNKTPLSTRPVRFIKQARQTPETSKADTLVDHRPTFAPLVGRNRAAQKGKTLKELYYKERNMPIEGAAADGPHSRPAANSSEAQEESNSPAQGNVSSGPTELSSPNDSSPEDGPREIPVFDPDNVDEAMFINMRTIRTQTRKQGFLRLAEDFDNLQKYYANATEKELDDYLFVKGYQRRTPEKEKKVLS